PLAAFSDDADAGPADAIVVLGAPLGRDGELSDLAQERVEVAAALWRRGLAPVVCVTGGHCPPGYRDQPAEREGMAPYLVPPGGPPAALRGDRRATSTRENALRAAELLLPEGLCQVWLVTQPFHLRRARMWFERAGFEPRGWPIRGGVSVQQPRRA